MDGYLTKPIRPQELDEVLEECLKHRHAKMGWSVSSEPNEEY